MDGGLIGFLSGILQFNHSTWYQSILQIGVPVQAMILFSLNLFFVNRCFAISTMPADIYESGFILPKAIRKVAGVKFYLLVFVVLLLLFPFISWNTFEHGEYLRAFFTLLSLILGVTYSTYYFNYYFNKPHLIDRFLLLGCSLLVYVHPVFMLPTLLMAFILIGQFFIPLYNSWTDKMLTLEVCILTIPFLADY